MSAQRSKGSGSTIQVYPWTAICANSTALQYRQRSMTCSAEWASEQRLARQEVTTAVTQGDVIRIVPISELYRRSWSREWDELASAAM